MLETRCSSAEEFLEHLTMTNSRWGSSPMCTWVFRGVGNADYDLIPRAWRSPCNPLLERLAKFCDEWIRGNASRFAQLARYIVDPTRASIVSQLPEDVFTRNVASLVSRTVAETSAVENFIRLADEVGLRIPTMHGSPFEDYFSRLNRLNLNAVLMDGDRDWLEPALDDTFGLAQHHGVPTRLLDFTRRSLVAAFFAAREPSGERIAVWAVDLEQLMASRIRQLTCRRFENTFLHAQDGIFLYDAEAPYDFIATGVWPTFDAALSSEHGSETEKIIRKITLPASEARVVRRMLWRERVSAPHLMPTYDNIAAGVPVYWELLDDHLRGS